MSCILIQILWQVDDLNCFKWTFLQWKIKLITKIRKLKVNLKIKKHTSKYRTKFYIQTLTQIPHPMHNSSEIKAILAAGVTSIHNFPVDFSIIKDIRNKCSCSIHKKFITNIQNF